METTTERRSLRNFIIKSDREYNASFTTESGLEIFADRRYSADRLSNRIVKVVSLPATFEDCPIQPGYEVMVDPTIYYTQQYDGKGEIENPYMMDRRNGLFKIEPKMIVLYREPEGEWKGFGDNLLIRVEKTETELMAGSLVVGTETKEKTFIAYTNEALDASGVINGDEVMIDKNAAPVSFWIDGKEHYWIETDNVIAKLD